MNTDFELIRARRKTLSLRISETGVLIVRAPMRTPLFFIHRFIQEKTDWIARTRDSMMHHAAKNKKHFIEGEEFLYLGKYYPLHFDATLRSKIHFTNGFKVPELPASQLKKLFVVWYKARAIERSTERAHYFAEKIGVDFEIIRLSSASTRWGSCSSSKNLRINWRLIMADPAILDYVVVHELAHLKYMNHSRAFWELVEQQVPDYRTRRQWLRLHGHTLNI